MIDFTPFLRVLPSATINRGNIIQGQVVAVVDDRLSQSDLFFSTLTAVYSALLFFIVNSGRLARSQKYTQHITTCLLTWNGTN